MSELITVETVKEFWDGFSSTFELDDILPTKGLKRRKPLDYYAGVISRIEMPAHRELILSLSKRKLKGSPDVDRWVFDLMAKYQLSRKRRSPAIRKIGRVMRRIGRQT